jgi:hypothetical protein
MRGPFKLTINPAVEAGDPAIAPGLPGRFCEMKYLLEKETHNKNEDNTLKD